MYHSVYVCVWVCGCVRLGWGSLWCVVSEQIKHVSQGTTVHFRSYFFSQKKNAQKVNQATLTQQGTMLNVISNENGMRRWCDRHVSKARRWDARTNYDITWQYLQK